MNIWALLTTPVSAKRALMTIAVAYVAITGLLAVGITAARAPAVASLLAFAGQAAAGLGDDPYVFGWREPWLTTYDEPDTRVAVDMWADGVSHALRLAAESHGCTQPVVVSGRKLAAATADLLRQGSEWPLGAAVVSYGRLSGCDGAMASLLRSSVRTLRRGFQ